MVSGPTAPDMEKTIALLRSEADALADFLAGLDAEGWARQSACSAWTVADAAAHIAQGSQGSSLALTRAQNDNPVSAGGPASAGCRRPRLGKHRRPGQAIQRR